jgi:hypothetical protein
MTGRVQRRVKGCMTGCNRGPLQSRVKSASGAVRWRHMKGPQDSTSFRDGVRSAFLTGYPVFLVESHGLWLA